MTHLQNRDLARVLNGSQPYWSNSTCYVEYLTALGTWTYMTPTGVGTTSKWEDVLTAVFPWIAEN